MTALKWKFYYYFHSIDEVSVCLVQCRLLNLTGTDPGNPSSRPVPLTKQPNSGIKKEPYCMTSETPQSSKI